MLLFPKCCLLLGATKVITHRTIHARGYNHLLPGLPFKKPNQVLKAVKSFKNKHMLFSNCH